MCESKIDSIVRHSPALLLGGAVLVGQIFIVPQGWAFGAISGFMLWSLGIYGVAFRRWKTEPGLWMLAALLFLSLGSCSAYFEYRHWAGFFENIQANGFRGPARLWEIRASIDATIALALMTQSVKLGLSWGVKNSVLQRELVCAIFDPLGWE